MSDRPDWNSWILQKNAECEAEELKKSDSAAPYEELEKGKSFKAQFPNATHIHTLSNGGKVWHHPAATDPVTGHHSYDNYSVTHPKEGTYHAWMDRKANHLSFNHHQEDSDDGKTGIRPSKSSQPKILHHVKEAETAIRRHAAGIPTSGKIPKKV